MHQVLGGEVVDVVLEVLVTGGLLDCKALSLDETVEEVVLLAVLLLVIDCVVCVVSVSVCSLRPGDAELSLDAELWRLLLLLLWAGRLGTWCGAGGVAETCNRTVNIGLTWKSARGGAASPLQLLLLLGWKLKFQIKILL